jgi:hypothetical protein
MSDQELVFQKDHLFASPFFRRTVISAGDFRAAIRWVRGEPTNQFGDSSRRESATAMSYPRPPTAAPLQESSKPPLAALLGHYPELDSRWGIALFDKV